MAEANEIHHRTGENCLTITRHLMEGFIHVPSRTDLALTFATELLCQEGSKANLPLLHGLMGKLEPT
jgi:hypothetical protein